MREKQSPLEKEWAKLEKQEKTFLQKRVEKKDSKINQFLAERVPEKLQGTLDTAFAKAFYTVFEKGTDIIEKTYRKDEIEKTYKINEFADQLRGSQKSLKEFSKKASGSGNINLLLSGVSGVGLGVLGIGIPDIILFTGIMLKSVYEIALNYGFDYQNEEEKHFILLLIQGAVSYGDTLQAINEELNVFIEYGVHYEAINLKEDIQNTAACLSKELLYMKFLQGIPLVGAVGGAYDAIYVKQVVKYAEMKYRRRFYAKRRAGKNAVNEVVEACRQE